MKLQDEQIIDLFFARSEQAIEELDAKYGKLFFNLAERFVSSGQDAEECVNDAYLGVWNSIPPNRPERLASYVCRIVRNHAITRFHSKMAQKRRTACEVSLSELEACLPSRESPEDRLQAAMLTEYLTEFLKKQSQENRVIFMGRYWFADSYESIAEQTGLHVKTVSVRLTRLRKQLKRYLQDEGVFI